MSKIQKFLLILLSYFLINCCCFYLKHKSQCLVHLDDIEARLPPFHGVNSTSKLNVVVHEEVVKIEFPKEGTVSTSISSIKNKILELGKETELILFY